MTFSYVHLPNSLGHVCLSNLKYAGSHNRWKRCGHIKFDVPVWQLADTSAPKGIRARRIFPCDSCCLGDFINLKDRGSTVAGRLRRPALRPAIIQNTQVSVVEDCHGQYGAM